MFTDVALPDKVVSFGREPLGGFCAVLANHEAWCWAGAGAPPKKLLDGVATLAGSAARGCAVLTAGTVSCWGSNAEGQRGSTAAANAPPSQVLR